jgi:hypothetical protein
MFYPHPRRRPIRDYLFLILLATGFAIDVYRGGIMNKTNVHEPDLRTGWHNSSSSNIAIQYGLSIFSLIPFIFGR